MFVVCNPMCMPWAIKIVMQIRKCFFIDHSEDITSVSANKCEYIVKANSVNIMITVILYIIYIR